MTTATLCRATRQTLATTFTRRGKSSSNIPPMQFESKADLKSCLQIDDVGVNCLTTLERVHTHTHKHPNREHQQQLRHNKQQPSYKRCVESCSCSIDSRRQCRGRVWMCVVLCDCSTNPIIDDKNFYEKRKHIRRRSQRHRTTDFDSKNTVSMLVLIRELTNKHLSSLCGVSSKRANERTKSTKRPFKSNRQEFQKKNEKRSTTTTQLTIATISLSACAND